jgi:hypothetical protein
MRGAAAVCLLSALVFVSAFDASIYETEDDALTALRRSLTDESFTLTKHDHGCVLARPACSRSGRGVC